MGLPHLGHGPVPRPAVATNEGRPVITDLLINVTGFFRDARAFEELRRKAIVPLVQANRPRSRCGVGGGCASGERRTPWPAAVEEVAAAAQRCAVQVFDGY
jgi:chemotaxis methyl-accepting protein methylase